MPNYLNTGHVQLFVNKVTSNEVESIPPFVSGSFYAYGWR